MFHCYSCGEPSFPIICGACTVNLLTPSLFKREIDGIQVFSFYKYSEIEKFLLTKHKPVGAKIYEILAKESFAAFAKNFEFNECLNVVPIDDNTKNGYSHTAILANALKSKILLPTYGSLRATNPVTYSGQDLEFRQKNPRNFKTKNTKYNVVIVDDIITTGTTIKEAVSSIQKHGKEVVFALTLADAKE